MNDHLKANMLALSEIEAFELLRERLSEIFESEAEFQTVAGDIDGVAKVLSFEFSFEFKKSADGNSIRRGIDQLLHSSRTSESNDIPLLVVPYMSELGKQQCRKSRISWIDLSGNANIRDRALVIKVVGMRNRFKKRGRPRNPFAPKSSRVIRILLSDPTKKHFQKELVEQAQISKGMVSQIVASLKNAGYIQRSNGNAISVENPELLLAEWRHRYSLSNHSITKGHIYSPTKSGQQWRKKIGGNLSRVGIEYAFTGLAAAWQYAPFANYRLTSVYIERPLSSQEKNELGFNAEPRGANIWFIVPEDKGVFWGSREIDESNFVSPLQTYLDLEDHPERSTEAQQEIQSQFLSWSIDAI